MSSYIVVYLDNNNDGKNKRKVFATKKEVRQSEFYQAMQAGLKPVLMVEVRSASYQNEEYLWYKDIRYKMLRTYDRPDEWTELIAKKM